MESQIKNFHRLWLKIRGLGLALKHPHSQLCMVIHSFTAWLAGLTTVLQIIGTLEQFLCTTVTDYINI